MGPVIAFLLWILTQISYGVALATTKFREMVVQVMNPIAIGVFILFQIVSAITVWAVLIAYDPPNFAIILYTVSALCWVPLILIHLKWFGPNAVDPVIPQRIVVTMSFFATLLVANGIWDAASSATQVGLIMWCVLNGFNAVVWDLLYVNWIYETRDAMPT